MKSICYLVIISLWTIMILSSCSPAGSPSGKLTPSTGFESGAAQEFLQKDDGALTFSIPPDPGGPEYLWFNFLVKGKVKKGQTFILENAADAHQTGARWDMTRPVFSADGKTWVRATEVDYSRQFSLRQPLGRQVFQFKSPLEGDSLRVAYCYPYTTANLSEFLDRVKDRLQSSLGSIGKSEEGRNIPKFQIGPPTDDPTTLPPEIWVICREHPGETPASFVLEGMVQALLEEPSGKHLADKFSFNFVPMLNVDGVAHGYYYHNAKGVNLARDWDQFQSAEARELRTAMMPGLEKKQVRLVIDLHSSNDPTLGHFFLERPSSGLFPLDAALQTALFNSADGNYPQLQGKSTVRMLDIPGITGNALYKSFSVYCLYLETNYSRGADGSPVTPQSLRDTGKALVQALAEVLMGE
jgi:hypothetical protein